MGSTTSTPHSRRSGSDVRSTHQAAAVPITAVADGDQDGQLDGVAQQLGGQRPEKDAAHLGPSRLAGLHDEEHLRQQQRQGDDAAEQVESGDAAKPPSRAGW